MPNVFNVGNVVKQLIWTRMTRLTLSLLAVSMVLTMAGTLGGVEGWSPPCRVADRFGYLSRRCASDQIQAAVGTKNIEVAPQTRQQ